MCVQNTKWEIMNKLFCNDYNETKNIHTNTKTAFIVIQHSHSSSIGEEKY